MWPFKRPDFAIGRIAVGHSYKFGHFLLPGYSESRPAASGPSLPIRLGLSGRPYGPVPSWKIAKVVAC